MNKKDRESIKMFSKTRKREPCKCIYCFENISKSAIKCHKCGTFQNRMRWIHINFVVFSLIIALASVVGLMWGPIKTLFFQSKESDVHLETPYISENNIYLYINNIGLRPAIIASIKIFMGEYKIPENREFLYIEPEYEVFFDFEKVSDKYNRNLLKANDSNIYKLDAYKVLKNSFNISSHPNMQNKEILIEGRESDYKFWKNLREEFEGEGTNTIDEIRQKVSNIKKLIDGEQAGYTKTKFNTLWFLLQVYIDNIKTENLEKLENLTNDEEIVDERVFENLIEKIFFALSENGGSMEVQDRELFEEHAENYLRLRCIDDILSGCDWSLEVEVLNSNSKGEAKKILFKLDDYKKIKKFLIPLILGLNEKEKSFLNYF